MTIFMMGDSTMKFNDFLRYPQTGWGQVMQMFVKEDVLVLDYAENGRSTKSFIAEGRFAKILNQIKPNDIVICQFGHNDEKEYDKARYTAPYGEYQQNLKYFADEVHKHGAEIIYATSITRHKFDNGVCVNSHGEYPNAMLEFAKNNGYTCIDLNQKTIDLYTKLGEDNSKKFHMIFDKGVYSHYPDGSDDHSHLVYTGALMVAEIFTKEVLKTNHILKNYLIDVNSSADIDWAMLKD